MSTGTSLWPGITHHGRPYHDVMRAPSGREDVDAAELRDVDEHEHQGDAAELRDVDEHEHQGDAAELRDVDEHWPGLDSARGRA
jgi:hypothetical protein